VPPLLTQVRSFGPNSAGGTGPAGTLILVVNVFHWRGLAAKSNPYFQTFSFHEELAGAVCHVVEGDFIRGADLQAHFLPVIELQRRFAFEIAQSNRVLVGDRIFFQRPLAQRIGIPQVERPRVGAFAHFITDGLQTTILETEILQRGCIGTENACVIAFGLTAMLRRYSGFSRPLPEYWYFRPISVLLAGASWSVRIINCIRIE
jgi:hypothetical protein